MAHKIDVALSKKTDRCRQMILEEDQFTHEIMAVSLSIEFKQPTIEAYDGVMDSLNSLRTFIDSMRLYVAPNSVMCRFFP